MCSRRIFCFSDHSPWETNLKSIPFKVVLSWKQCSCDVITRKVIVAKCCGQFYAHYLSHSIPSPLPILPSHRTHTFNATVVSEFCQKLKHSCLDSENKRSVTVWVVVIIRKFWIARDTTTWKIQGELRRFERRRFVGTLVGRVEVLLVFFRWLYPY
jgi:hypothetical protein